MKVLVDAEVTCENLLQEAHQVSQRVKPGGTVWFLFIGHGAPSSDGQDGVLVATDASLDG